jgi:hypothetical protein
MRASSGRGTWRLDLVHSRSRPSPGESAEFTLERHSRDQPEGLSPAGEFRNVEEFNSVGAPEGTGSGAVEGSELNMTDDEEQIRRLIERWAEAVHGGDLSGVLADHSDDKQRHS